MRPIAPLVFIFSILPTLVTARLWTANDTDKCPQSIISYVDDGHCDDYPYPCPKGPRLESMAQIHSALLHCPNVTSLDLTLEVSGCLGDAPDRWNFPFDLAGQTTYPPIKILKLNGYAFDMQTWDNWTDPQYRHHNQTSAKEAHQKSNLELWMDAMDWSAIEELHINPVVPELPEKLPVKMNSLRKLGTTDVPLIQALRNNSLTHLTWVGPSSPADFSKILDRHGESLENLEFRCPEFRCSEFQTNFDLTILPNRTHNLKHISINLPRNGTWPLESLATLASIPTLQSAELYFSMQSVCRQQLSDEYYSSRFSYDYEFGEGYCKGEDQFQKPFLDESSALELFQSMKANKKGGQLTKVEFYVGDWDYRQNSLIPGWLHERRAKVICEVDADREVSCRCSNENAQQRRFDIKEIDYETDEFESEDICSGKKYWLRENVYAR